MRIYGYIKDATNADPLASATVRIYSGSSVLTQHIADRDGYFDAHTAAPATHITISRVGYKPFTFPASEYQHTWELERDEKMLDPVIITANNKKKSFLIWALLALVVIKSAK